MHAQLTRLAEFDAGPELVVSVYLNLHPAGQLRRTYQV